MRKLLLLVIISCAGALAQTTATCVTPIITANPGTATVAPGTLDLSHNWARLSWTCNQASGSQGLARIKYWNASGTCTSGSPCWDGQDSANIAIAAGQNWLWNFVGLTPGLQYNVVAEISQDGGGTWSTPDPSPLVFTTLASPPHPVYPTPVVEFKPCGVQGTNCVQNGRTIVVNLGGATCTNLAPGVIANLTWQPGMYGGTTSCVDVNSNPSNTDTIQHALYNGSSNSHFATYGDVVVLPPGQTSTANGATQTTNLHMADAIDQASWTITGVTGSTLTTSSAHGLKVGQQVRMGTFSGGQESDATVFPISAGYPYFVVAVPNSTSFEISVTAGGAAIPFSSPQSATMCAIVGSDVPMEQDIVIRSSAPDNMLPPVGVRLDASYLSMLTIFQNTDVTSGVAAYSFHIGCQPHHYHFGPGIEFVIEHETACTLGTPDCFGTGIQPQGELGQSDSHMTIDRNYITGDTTIPGFGYPDRMFKFFAWEGSNQAFINNLVTDIGAWTPADTYRYNPNGSTRNASGTSTQVMLPYNGGLWRGWPIGTAGLPSPQCPNSPTVTITGGSGGDVYWEITGTCANHFSASPGITLTAVDTSGASFTVTNSSTPQYTCNGGTWNPATSSGFPACVGGLFGEWPIAHLVITGTSITNFVPQPSGYGMYGGNYANDGPGVLMISSFGPGPYLIDNNAMHNMFGIPLYLADGNSNGVISKFQNQGSDFCQTTVYALCTRPVAIGNFSVTRNTIVVDRPFMPNFNTNTSWNGYFANVRQSIETKESKGSRYRGNIIGGIYCAEGAIVGPTGEIGSLNTTFNTYPSTATTSDFELSYNTMYNSCGDGMQIVGKYANFQIFQNVATQRVLMNDNSVFGINIYTNSDWESPPGFTTANGDVNRYIDGAQDVINEHNSYDVSAGSTPANALVQCSATEGATFRNNFMGFSNDSVTNPSTGNGGLQATVCYANHANPNNGSSVMGDVFTNMFKPNGIFNNLIWLGGYSNSAALTEMNNSNIAAVAGSSTWTPYASNRLAWVNPTTSTIATRHAAIGWMNPGNIPPISYRLSGASIYNSAGTSKAGDGGDIGADTVKQDIFQGTVQNAHVYSNVSGGANLVWVAPDKNGLSVDWTMNDPTFQPLNLHRIPGVSGNRVQTATIFGATNGATVYWRVNGAAQQPTGSFTAITTGSSVLTFGAVADAVMRTDGAITAGSGNLTSASGTFVSGDVGKYIQVIGAGAGGTTHSDGDITNGAAVLTSAAGTFASTDIGRGIIVLGAGASGGNLITTITAFTSATQVTLGNDAGTTVSNHAYFYGYMTLDGTITAVGSGTSITVSNTAFGTMTSATYVYGTDNSPAFQSALDTVGTAGGGTVNVPAPSSCPSGATCGYVLNAINQATATQPASIYIRFSNVSLIGAAPQVNLFTHGEWQVYNTSIKYGSTPGTIRGFGISLGDDGGVPTGAIEAVNNVTVANLHLYGMTNGNTFNVSFNFAAAPLLTTGDGWDITNKAIYWWENANHDSIVVDNVTTEGYKAENVYTGGGTVTNSIIRNSVIKNFNGDGISMLAASLQVTNNFISNGSNAGIENSTVAASSAKLVSQVYQGNTFSLFPREGLNIVGVDTNAYTSGAISITDNYFDTIAQINRSGAQAAIFIQPQSGGGNIAPSFITVDHNTCHDCQGFINLENTSTVAVTNNTVIVDKFISDGFMYFTFPMTNFTVTGNLGYLTPAGAIAGNHLFSGVYVMNPGYGSGNFDWNNVAINNNTYNLAGSPQYEFNTTSGPGWGLVTGHNIVWGSSEVCNGCTWPDVNHGQFDITGSTTILPLGPIVFVINGSSPITATIDASKEQGNSTVTIVNNGTANLNFVPDANMAVTLTISAGGQQLFKLNSSGKWGM